MLFLRGRRPAAADKLTAQLTGRRNKPERRTSYSMVVSADDVTLTGKNDQTAVARITQRARAKMSEPRQLQGELPIRPARVRVKATAKGSGKCCGVYEVHLEAPTPAAMEKTLNELEDAGLFCMATASDFSTDTCSYVVVPRTACVGPLISNLMNKGKATYAMYEIGGARCAVECD